MKLAQDLAGKNNHKAKPESKITAIALIIVKFASYAHALSRSVEVRYTLKPPCYIR
jgi:hypothetical protein